MVDVVSDQIEVFYADVAGGWDTGLEAYSAENEILVQGTASCAVVQTANGVNEVAVDAGTSWNMAGKHLRMYINTIITPNMAATNAIQIFASDGTNTAFWTVANAGSDYAGGWQDYFVSIDSAPTSGSVNSAAVTRVGIRINTATKPRNSPANGWYDNWRFGNGLEVNSTTTEAISLTDVATEDSLVANKYNIIEEVDGVLFTKGSITAGNLAGAKNCNLVSLNETIFFVDRAVSSTLYGLIGEEGTGSTDISITGLVCKTVGNSGAELNFSAALSSFLLSGSTFIDMGTMQFGSGTIDTTKFNGCGATNLTNVASNSLSWITCGDVTLASTATLDLCSLKDTTLLPTTLNNITNGVFESSGTGIGVDLGTGITTQTMSWDCTDSGYAGVDGSTGNETIKVSVADNNTLTINVEVGASVPTIFNSSAGNGIVTVVAGQKTLTLTGLETGSDVVILAAGTDTILADVDQGGTTFAYVYSSVHDIDIGVIKPGFVIKYLYGFTLDTVSANLPIEQSPDRSYI